MAMSVDLASDNASRLDRRLRRRAFPRIGVAVALLATSLMAVVIDTAAAPPASAAPPLDCVGAVYIADNASGNARRVDIDTGAVSGAAYDATPNPGTTVPNQIGISANGLTAISADAARIVTYDTVTGTVASPVAKVAAPSGIAGAINPANGLYYYGGYSGTAPNLTLSLNVFDPATNTTVGPVAQIATPAAPGGNGDIAFDAAGRLYYAASSATASSLYRLDATLPTATPVQNFTSTRVVETPLSQGSAVNGIAFGSDGFLYLGYSTGMAKANPITGAIEAVRSFGTGIASTDLGSCASPSQLSVKINLPDGRISTGDQFVPGFSGSDYDGTPPGPTGTTTGTDSGLQNTPAEIGQGLVIPGDPYSVDVAGSGSTNLAAYVTSYSCTNDVTGAVVASGPGTSFAYTPPSSGAGSLVTCVVTAAKPAPAITLTKSVTPTTFTAVGQTLTFRFDVTNSGNTVLNNYTVTDTMPGLSALACTPAQGSTLQPGGTAACTATYAVTSADIAAGANKTNNATVRGVPPVAQGGPVTDTDSATSRFAATPPVATDDAANTPFNTPVTLPASTNDNPGTGAILNGSTVFTSPAATGGGKTLTTPEGTWQVNPAGTVTFTPAPGYSGTTPAVEYRIVDDNGLSDTANLTVTVRPGPTAAPDTSTTPQDQNVTVNPLANDTPGRNANGTPGTWNATSVVFNPATAPAGSTITNGGKTLTVPGQGTYTVDPVSGAITFDPLPSFLGPAAAVGYSVTDSLGNTASSTVQITVTAVPPIANDDSANTPFNTPVVLPAGTDDTPGAGGAIDQSLTVLTSPAATNGGKTLVTPQGTWQVRADGTVEFTPVAGYTGTTPAVEYRITDGNGQSDTADLRVTVRPGPTAAPDTDSTRQNVDVTLTPLGNDTPGRNADGSPGQFDPTTVTFPVAGQPAGATVTGGGKTLTVPGEGVYTIDGATGAVTFDPEPAFTGTATPVRYTVVDQAGNQTGSTITITVDPVRPVAGDDAAKTPAGRPVTLTPVANDRPGDPSAPLDPTSIRLTSPDATNGGTTLVVPGQGTWQVNPDGTVTFTPLPSFEGQTTPAVEYVVTDANGSTDTATMTVVVGKLPLAAPDQAVTPQNTDVVVPTLGNDIPGDQGDPCATGETPPADCDTGTFDPGSVVFPAAGQPGGATPTDGGRTLVIPGEGTYTIDPATGDVTFDPAPGFTGTAQPVRYEVTDSYANVASSTITITVLPIRPDANDDSALTPFNTPVTLPATLDDTPGDPQGGTPAPLVPASTVFPAAGQPAGATVSNGGKTLTVAGEGVYVVNGDGSVTFTPADGFSGATSPVTYRIEDTNGTTDTAQLSVTVRSGPVAVDDVDSTPQNVDVTVSVLGNDTPGENADGSPGSWVAASVVFSAAGQPAGSTVSDGGKTLTVPGEGVYAVNADGSVTFDPAPLFAGVASGAAYTVTDSLGNDASAVLVITVAPIVPSADDDRAVTPFETPVTFSFAGNDEPGAPSAPIVDDSGTFEAGDNPAGWTIGNGGKTITVPGEGAYTLNDDGTVTFTPAAGFEGASSPVTYTIRDANGTAAKANISVTVRSGPVAVDDVDSTPQNVDVTVSVLGNDTPGENADGSPGSWVAASVVFSAAGQPAGSTVSDGGKTLTVPGEGVYAVNADGSVTFDPAPLFAGVASGAAYTVTDSLGNDASAVLVITVAAITPSANDDAASTPLNTPVTLPGLTDDTAGAPGAPLVAGLTVFPTAGQPASATVSPDGKTITVPGEGTYVIGADGSVVFTPVTGFNGTTTPVTYRIEDTNGTTDTAQLTVTVRRGPSASPDDATTPQNVNVTIPVLGNDSPGLDAAGDPGDFDLASVVFTTAGQPAGATVSPDGKRLTVPGEGVYTVNPAGTITFDPDAPFTGVASRITYAVSDEFGNDVSSTVVVTVAPVAPLANDDAASTPFGTPVTLPGLTDDAAGSASAPLVPQRTVFPTTGQPTGATVSADGKTITVPGEGGYRILADGSVVFTPAPGFSGVTSPVTYRIEDTNGSPATARLTVTVQPGPKAVNDTGTTPQNVDVTVSVLGNDTPGRNADGTPGTWVASSVVFPAAGQPAGATVSADGKTLTVPGQGTYKVSPDGTITFDPEPKFTGSASPVGYTVTDSLGNPASATLTITVAPVAPQAKDDRATTPHATPVVIDVLANDTAGSAAAPLVPSTLFLVDPETGAEVTRVVVRGEGVWTVVDGQVRFEPEKGFTGPASPIDYVISDVNGSQTSATITVVVGPLGQAKPDRDSTTQGNPVTVDVLDNDSAAPGEKILPGSVCLVPETAQGRQAQGRQAQGRTAQGAAAKCVKVFTLVDVGTWQVNGDGTITFTPADGYTGVAEIDYTVEDSGGNVYDSTLSITVEGDQGVADGQGEDGPDGPREDGSGLPDTGGPQMALLLLALASVLLGGVLLLARRRVRS